MEEAEYKDNEKVLFKASGKPLGMEAKEADFFVTEGHVIIEMKEPIKIPMANIKDCRSPADNDAAVILGVETAQTTTVTLTYRDTSGQSRAMKFDMSMRDARSLNITVEAARRKLLQASGVLLYAGFWLRFVAYIIDGILLGIISIILVFVTPYSIYSWLMGVITLVYYIGCWTWWGQTPGKMAMGVKIVTSEGKPISLGRAIVRYFGYIVSGIILYIGYFMIGWDSKKQGLHDKIAGTYVVKTNYLG
jgi:uncharacterized RDD family membrane protein YckC